MDELAYKLGLDPIEIRLRNHADVDPSNDQRWSSKSLKQCYARGQNSSAGRRKFAAALNE